MLNHAQINLVPKVGRVGEKPGKEIALKLVFSGFSDKHSLKHPSPLRQGTKWKTEQTVSLLPNIRLDNTNLDRGLEKLSEEGMK